MSMLPDFSLAGKTAVVAGASRGIGLAIAQAVAASGARTILASRSLDQLQKEAAALSEQGYAAEARRLDFADRNSIQEFAAALPAVDILINVSGINIRKAFVDYTQAEYEQIMQVNLHGLVQLTQQVGKGMLERKTGKVIFVGSLMSILGLPYLAPYAMTKSALAGLTRVLAAEWARYDIQVNCIAPGFIITDLNREMWKDAGLRAWLKGAQANPDTGVPQDIAALAVFLSSPAARYITGQVIPVDGGYSTTRNWPFQP